MSRNNIIILTLVLAVFGALGLRVWWYWPEKYQGGLYLEKIEKRGQDYSLYIRQGCSLSDVVDLTVFEGYSPSNHIEYQERLESRPSKFIKDDDHHYYVEYVGKYGKMQFHSGYHEDEGISYWFEFLPSDLPVDSFLNSEVAINLDLSKKKFKVYIPFKREHMYMTIMVNNRKVERVAWLDW